MEPREELQTGYLPAWMEYRRRRLLAILFSVGFLALTAIAGKIFSDDRFSSVVVWILAITLLGGAVTQGWRVAIWPCPKCGKAFRGTAPFPRRCRHCGLPIWAEGPHASSKVSP